MMESNNGIISRAGVAVKKIGQKIGLSPAEDPQYGIHQLSLPYTSLALGAGDVENWTENWSIISGRPPIRARRSYAQGTPQETNRRTHTRDKSTSSSQAAVLEDPRMAILNVTGVSTSVVAPFHHVPITEPSSPPSFTSPCPANDAEHAQETSNANQFAMNKPPRPFCLFIQTDANDHSLHGKAARGGKDHVSGDDLEIPLSGSPTQEDSQPLSAESQLQSATCLSREKIHSRIYLQPVFDATVPALRTYRKEKIPDLTGCISKEVRLCFETAISDVWKGWLNGQRMVAIKSLRRQKIDLNRFQKRIQREVGTWWCFDHENVLPLLGLTWDEEFGTFPAIISPWCINGNAQEYLEHCKDTITFSGRIRLFHDVAGGLNYIHTFSAPFLLDDSSSGSTKDNITLVHGDLKPNNVLVDEHGVAKLCDFGLIRLIVPRGTIGMSTMSAHTGTPRYLSFELANGDASPTQASDVHALGCVGMEFIFSLRPYDHISNQLRADYKIIIEISKKVPPAVRPEDTPGAVSELWDMFQRCWNLKPTDRPKAENVCRFLREHHERLATDLGSHV